MVKDHKEHTELNLASAGEQSVYIQFYGLGHLSKYFRCPFGEHKCRLQTCTRLDKSKCFIALHLPSDRFLMHRQAHGCKNVVSNHVTFKT